MAVYRVINKPGDYRLPQSVENVLNYVMNPQKTRPAGIVGGAVVPQNAVTAMNGVINSYENENGLLLRHSVLAFSKEDNISWCDAATIAKEAIAFYSNQYQTIAAVHEDSSNLHVHIVMNTTNYNNGSKYNGNRNDYHSFEEHLNQILGKYDTNVQLRTSYDQF